MSANCDLKDVLTTKDKTGKLLYGKKMLTSHRGYNLWNEETNEFNLPLINKFYMMFLYNMTVVGNDDIFKPLWVDQSELLTTSKGLIWDWTSEEEKIRTTEDIYKNGVYFPILTLDKGLLHNQIMNDEQLTELAKKGLYNSYNGNHRIDAIHYLVEQDRWPLNKKVLIYIIPPYCQKSCTGFKYDLIDDSQESHLTQWKLPKPVHLVHMDYVEHEMKVINWREKQQIIDGVSLVMVDNYNVAFRIILELQNILEPALTRYYEIYKTLPNYILRKSLFFNDIFTFNRVVNYE